MIHNAILLPALRAAMGDWTYYIASMTVGELASRVSTATNLHQSDSLDKEIQRSIKPRAKDIAQYLRFQKQRFFGSLVVGVYGGEPEWLEVEITESARPWDENNQRLDGSIGLLHLSGAEQLFALDGQHRLLGMIQALEEDTNISTEEVAVIFVGHSNDEAGLQRTRRLFSTLNRYAKQVSRREIIALDEDDAVAIVTRRLVKNHPLFLDRVHLGGTKAVSKNDGTCITSIIALSDCIDMVLGTHQAWQSRYRKFRPSDHILERLEQYCTEYWNIVVEEHEVLRTYIGKATGEKPAEHLRGRHGGHLFFRPIGLMAHTLTSTTLVATESVDFREAIQRLTVVPMELSANPWLGLFWDGENQRMITSKEAQRVAHLLMYYSVNGDLRQLGSDEEKLRRELAGLLNQAPEDIALPRYST